MFSSTAINLVKELNRSDKIPNYDESSIEKVRREIQAIQENIDLEMHRVSEYINSGQTIEDKMRNQMIVFSCQMNTLSVQRNKRCVLAYLYGRIKRLERYRWNTGSVLDPSIRKNLSKRETTYFTRYNSLLSKYMKSVGLDLAQRTTPPKDLYVQVRVLKSLGKVFTKSGSIQNLERHATLYMLGSDAEAFIRQGTLELVKD